MHETLFQKLMSPWVAVGLIAVVVAAITGLVFSPPVSDGIFAEERESVPAPDPDKARTSRTIKSDTVEVVIETTGGSTTTMAVSAARQEFLDAAMGRALYFARDDRVIHLPDGVSIQGIVVSALCPIGEVCPETPYYVLEKGEATIALDRYGDIIADGPDTDDPSAFPFLAVDED